jgi:hypothetical protein
MSDPVAHPESVITRFWKYTQRGSNCWNWIGSRMVRGGYGQLNSKGKLLKAHRLSFEIHYGKIPDGLFICHRCNNPACVNPNHLYAGTPADNWSDTIRTHGLRLPENAPIGEKHHDAKLTTEQVREIRVSTESGVTLAKRFNVTRSTISSIRRGKTWKTIP